MMQKLYLCWPWIHNGTFGQFVFVNLMKNLIVVYSLAKWRQNRHILASFHVSLLDLKKWVLVNIIFQNHPKYLDFSVQTQFWTSEVTSGIAGSENGIRETFASSWRSYASMACIFYADDYFVETSCGTRGLFAVGV